MKQIRGSWTNSDGSPVSDGRVFFKLNQNASAIGGPQISSTDLVSFTLDNTGSIPVGSELWVNDELTPVGSTYKIAVLAAGGGLVWKSNNTTISGAAPINLNNVVPS